MAERLVTAGERGDRRRRSRVDRRLADVAATASSPDAEDVRFVAGVLRGNVRLLLGMVAANRPWRLAVGLSRALAAALGAAAFALVTSDIWQLADSLGPVRLAGLTLLSVGATVVTLIVAHELWEHGGDGLRREQAVLFNAATTITVVLGVLVLYAALFAVALAGGWLVLAERPARQDARSPPEPERLPAPRLARLVAVDGRRGARRRPRERRDRSPGGLWLPPRSRRGPGVAYRPGRRGGMSAKRPRGDPRERSRRDDAAWPEPAR